MADDKQEIAVKKSSGKHRNELQKYSTRFEEIEHKSDGEKQKVRKIAVE